MNNSTHSTHARFIKLSMICFLSSFFTSCIQQPTFEQNAEIPNHSWSTQDIQKFKVHITDNKTPFNLILNIRHRSTYQFSNLALSVQERTPNGTKKTYRVIVPLAEPDGRWKGVGSGNLLSNQVFFLKNTHLADTGFYTFELKPIMQISPLPGIVNIGLRVEKTK